MQDVRDNKLFSNLSVIGGGLLIVIALGAIVYFSLQKRGFFLDKENGDRNKIAAVRYICDEKKTFSAIFFDSKKSTENFAHDQNSSISNASVVLKLDDGRNFDLNHTVSGEGLRYSNKDQSFVFWEKATGAVILEFDTERFYRGCKKYDPTENSYTNLVSYLDETYSFNINYPKDYLQDKKYKYTIIGQDSSIDGVRFTIPKNYTDSNNLSKESYISIENIPNFKSCSASLFLLDATPKNISENGSDYSFAFREDLASDEKYEEYVYAFKKDKVCFGVRYFIGYSYIENHTAQAVTTFNKDNLLKEFNFIRDSLEFKN
jgi:membrane-bound inhibitor of C-type lysozyme